MSNVRNITPLPPADFTPELGYYKALQPFRYWCQKVLPLVYDDSLSYYELLCKVVDYLNKTMEDVETLYGDVTNLHTAYEKLQSYVNNYFSTLDVQENINNKLDSMVTDGTFSIILEQYLNTLKIKSSYNVGVSQAMYDCIYSYLKNNDKLMYAHKVNPDNPELPQGNSAMVYDAPVDLITNYDRTGYAINCSTFVLLVLLGVPFEYSAYNTLNGVGGNTLGKMGYCYNIYNEPITSENYDEYYNTIRMYKKFVNNGEGYVINKDYTNVDSGDVVFFTHEKNNVEQIHHCGIVLSNSYQFEENDSKIPVLLIAETTGGNYPIRLRWITSEQCITRGLFYGAKPRYDALPIKRSNLFLECAMPNDVRLEKSSGLDCINDEILTFDFDFIPKSINSTFSIRVNGNTTLNPPNRMEQLVNIKNTNQIGVKQHKCIMMPMLPSVDPLSKPDKITSIRLTCELGEIQNLKIYKDVTTSQIIEDCVECTSLDELKDYILSIIPDVSTKLFRSNKTFYFNSKGITINKIYISDNIYKVNLLYQITPTNNSYLAIFSDVNNEYILQKKGDIYTEKIVEY